MMKLMRFKWKYLLASLLLANMLACSNDDLTQMNNQQEQDSGTRTAEWFTKTITLDAAGTLETKLTAEMGGTDVTTLEKLVVSGPFAAADMTYVRNSLTGLVAIDMKDAVITPSSDIYNPNGWDSFSFENDKICPLMFSQMTSIEEIVLPNTVTSVGEQAFYGCNSLNTVVIPDGVVSIGNSAFIGCEKLHSLTLPANLEEIGYYAFENCSSLESIVIPDKVKKLDSGTFSFCKSLTSVTLSANLEELGNRAFEKCNSIKNIIIPDGVKSIGDNAFYNCNSLESITISASSNLETIGSWAFYNCDFLKSIVIPEGVKEITTHCFYSCDSLEAVSFPSSLEKIGYGSFWGCNLKDIEIPDGVTEIGDYAFYICRNLTSIKFPSELKSIGEKAFTDCVSFKTTYRIYDENKMACADLISLRDETFDTTKPLTIFHPIETWKKTTLEKYSMRNLMVEVFRDGEQVYNLPTLKEIADYSKIVRSEFWEEYLRLMNPNIYKVDLSDKLYNLKKFLTYSHTK